MSISVNPMKDRSFEEWSKIASNGPDDFGAHHGVEMLLALQSGAWWLGKIPAETCWIGDDGNPTGETKLTGPVRSLLDPELPPANSEFYLASYDGANWNYSIPAAVLDVEKSLKFGRALDRASLHNSEPCPGDFRFFTGRLKDTLVSRKRSQVVTGLMEALRSGETTVYGAKKALRGGDIALAFSLMFEEGRKHGTRHTLERIATLQEAWTANEWNIAAYLATKRHGRRAATALLTLMGGTKDSKKHEWNFPSGAVVDQRIFQEAHKAALKRLDSEEEGSVKPFCLGQ